MSLIQIEKEEPKTKLMTLQEFMPLWTRWAEMKMNHMDKKADAFIEQMNLSITTHKMCMVGEANNFSDSYIHHSKKRCDFCRDVSNNSPSYGAIEAENDLLHKHDGKIFFEMKRKLYDHFMDEHKELLVK